MMPKFGSRVRSAGGSILVAGSVLGMAMLGLQPVAAQTQSPAEAAAAAARAAAQPAPETAPRVRRAAPRIAAVRLGPSGYLDPAALDAVARDFIGQPMDGPRLDALLQRLAGLYDAEGITLATPVIEGTDPRRGEVRIGFVEARLGRVRSAAPHIDERWLAWRLGLLPGALADNRLIASGLERLTLTEDMFIDADFAPGARPGETDLVIRAETGPRVSTLVSADSYGTRGNGRIRLGVNTRIGSLSGRNDPLTLGATLREGAVNLSLGYARVIRPDGTRLTLSAEAGRTRNLTGTDLRGRTLFLGAGISHPAIIAPDRRLAFSALVQRFSEEARLAGVTTLDQRGWVLSVGASGSRMAADWTASGGVDLMLGRLDDRVAAARRSFAALGFNAVLSRHMGSALTGSLTMSGQLALRGAMPAAYAFTVTSPFAVRGYPSGALSGDSGFVVRAQVEARRPLGGEGGRIQVFPFAFADAGLAAARVGGRHVTQGRAMSVGLGLSAVVGRSTSAEMFLAKPLRALPGQPRGGWRVEVGLRHRF